MPDGYGLGDGNLDGLASTLRTASATLGGIGAAPPAPDAGDLSGDLAMVMVAYTDCAAELVLGVGTAGDNLAEGSTDYLTQEDAAAHNLTME